MNIPGLGGTLRDAILAIREMARGASNATGSLTLAAGATTTEVPDDRASASSVVLLSPTSASAAAAAPWVSGKGKGRFILAHPAAAAGCTFDYLILH